MTEDKARFEIASPDKKVRFICGTYPLSENNRQLDSYLCLTTWHSMFVKYRLSNLRVSGSAANGETLGRRLDVAALAVKANRLTTCEIRRTRRPRSVQSRGPGSR